MSLTNESILTSVKKVLGIAEDYKAFDSDILMHINTVFSELYQLGVGRQDRAFYIEDDAALWTEFLGNDPSNILMVKSYICLSVRLMFDPPATSFAIEAIKGQLLEMKWRLNIMADRPTPITTGVFNG